MSQNNNRVRFNQEQEGNHNVPLIVNGNAGPNIAIQAHNADIDMGNPVVLMDLGIKAVGAVFAAPAQPVEIVVMGGNADDVDNNNNPHAPAAQH